MLLIV